MADEERIKELSDGLNNVITACSKMHLKGPMKHGKRTPDEVVNWAEHLSREALAKAGLRVRKTGYL